MHLAKEWAQIAKNKAFGRKKMPFSIIHTATTLCAITALLIRSMELMEAKKAKETCNHQGKSTEWHLSPIEIAKHRTRKTNAVHIVICGVLQKQQF